MATAVKCRLCTKKITYRPDQINYLGEHLLRNHPNEELTHFSFEDDTGGGMRYFHGRDRSDDFGDDVFYEAPDAGDTRRERMSGKISGKMFKTTGLVQNHQKHCCSEVQPHSRFS